MFGTHAHVFEEACDAEVGLPGALLKQHSDPADVAHPSRTWHINHHRLHLPASWHPSQLAGVQRPRVAWALLWDLDGVRLGRDSVQLAFIAHGPGARLPTEAVGNCCWHSILAIERPT